MTETNVSAQVDDAAQLRERLIGELRALHALRSEAVEEAVRAVPRHLFIPEASPEQAYAAERAEVVKRDEHGVALSSVSAARIQAFMLEQADIRPGMRVLEIGSGGLNAAMIAELVGRTGAVTTMDIDPDVVDRARRLLLSAGYGHVHTLCADGAQGAPEQASFDRIVVTVEAADLAGAWWEQLAEHGRIVVPLRVRGLNRSVAFQRTDGYLVSRDYEVCGFVPMQGTGARPEQLVVLHEGEGEQVGLRLEDTSQVDRKRLTEALSGARAETWSGMTMGLGGSYDDLDLWLATQLDGYALLAATRQARERGLVASFSPMGVSTLVQDASFAYLAMRPVDAERTEFEFGAVGHGPEAEATAEQLSAQIQSWNTRHREQRAEFRAYPSGMPDEQLPAGRVLDGDSRITISWPPRTH